MATAGQTLVQLPQEDLQKLLAEVTALRQEVLFLREEREVHQQRLALSDARIQVLEEGQKVTDVSPPTSPAHPVQAEPSDSEIEMEATVEPAEEAPFTLVQGKHQRKRPTPESAPMTQAVKSGPSGEPSQARAPKMPTPEVPQTQTTQPAPVKPVTQQKPPAESKIPPVAFASDGAEEDQLLQSEVLRRRHPGQPGHCRRFSFHDSPPRGEGGALSHLRPPRGKDTPSRAPNGAGGNQRRRRQSRLGEPRSGA
jgi:hypothetical protein